jgi:hypothetical protein
LTLGDESSPAGLITEISAAITRSPVTFDSLSLMFGDYDLARPLVVVSTRWDGSSWHVPRRPAEVPASSWDQIPPCAWELGEAERRDAAIASRDWRALVPPQWAPVEGPFVTASAEIVVSGSRRTVPAVSYRHYTALAFAEDGAEVTVVSRHGLPAIPQFDVVADLEPFIAGYARVFEVFSGDPMGRG